MSPKEALDLIEKFLPWRSNNSEVDTALKTLRSAVSEQTAHNTGSPKLLGFITYALDALRFVANSIQCGERCTQWSS